MNSDLHSASSVSSTSDAYMPYDYMADGYQFGDIFKSIIEGGFVAPYKQLFGVPNSKAVEKVVTGQIDGTPVSGSKAGDSSVDLTGQDSNTYHSDDQTGYDQASWALEQQWKLDQAERDYNSAEAAKQREWEKMMSDTAVSRAVADIKNAGLNPWLALNGGSLGSASTPSGASASASSGASKMPVNYLMALLSGLMSSASKIIAAFA